MGNLNVKISFLFLVGEIVSRRLPRGVNFIKNALRTTFFRNGWYRDDHDELDRIYQALKDPWNFESSPFERARLHLLFEKVTEHPHDSILEVGCAEGVFTSMIAGAAQRVVAIDVSPTAIARAQTRCPKPTYRTTSLQEFQANEVFDLVVCAETLYYMKDVARAIEKLSSLGRYCVVSYLEREAERLNPYLVKIPSVVTRRYVLGQGILKRALIVASWQGHKPASADPSTAKARGVSLPQKEEDT